MGSRLAIVIPAYKADFFEQTLYSFANQTRKDFHLYVGDDASPQDIESIVDRYRAEICLSYFRFEYNLGAKHLSKQWDRCIGLSQEEEFIWLFSDDDLLPQDAVERFYKFLDSYPDYAIYRFNIQLINEANETISEVTKHPQTEEVEEFIESRLLGKTHSSVIEYIFTRGKYAQLNGFVEFPLAWASDDATWIQIGKEKGIITIPGSPVLWRQSGMNISSMTRNRNIKFKAMLLFYQWLSNNGIYNSQARAQISTGVFRQAYILRIRLFHFFVNLHRIRELVGPMQTYKLGSRILRYTIKKHLGIAE